MSLTMPGVYFLPLRVCALCWVETTTLVQPTGVSVDVLYRHLALGVGLKIKQRAGAALFRKHFKDLVRKIDRRRHERALFIDLALRAGVAEHHALIAGAFFVAGLFLLGVDAHRDVRRLAVQQHFDVGAVEGKTILVVADVLDHLARGLGDQFAINDRLVAMLVEQRGLATTLASDDDLVGRAKRLAAKPGVDFAFVGDAELDVVFEERIKNGVGDLVANLVRMSFRHGLAGKQIICTLHCETLPSSSRARLRRSLFGTSAGETQR